MRLFPRPSAGELRDYYPSDYWYVPAAAQVADRWAERYRRFVLRDHLRFVERALDDANVAGPVLDVGCGGGLFLRMLADRGRKIVAGLDFSLDAAASAWRVNRVPAVCSTLFDAPFREQSCAAVTMFHVLEHLYDPAGTLERARKLLKPGGRLIAQVPNAGCWQFLLLGENWSGVDAPRHLIHFRVRELEELLESRGFEVLRHKHFSLRDNPAGLATSLAPWLDPMARRIRRVAESRMSRLVKDALYFAMTAAAVPFTVVEAACRAGSTIMVEARPKP